MPLDYSSARGETPCVHRADALCGIACSAARQTDGALARVHAKGELASELEQSLLTANQHPATKNRMGPKRDVVAHVRGGLRRWKSDHVMGIAGIVAMVEEMMAGDTEAAKRRPSRTFATIQTRRLNGLLTPLAAPPPTPKTA